MKLSLQHLRARLGLLLALAFAPVLGVTVYRAYIEQAQRMSEMEASELRLARQVATTYEQVIQRAYEVLRVLAQLLEVRQLDASACNALLAELVRTNSQYANFSVARPDGEVICSGIPFTKPLNVARTQTFARALDTRGLAVGDYLLSLISGRPVLGMALPALDERGEIVAVAGALLSVDWLNELAAEISLPEGTSLTVVDRSGHIVVRQPDPEKWVGRNVRDTPLFAARERGDTRFEATGLDGLKRSFVIARVQGVPPPAWLSVSVGIDQRRTLAPIRAALYRDLSVLGGVGLLAVLAAWFGTERTVVRRVNALLAATRRLTAGDLGARAGATGGARELRQLGRAFDDMAVALQQREREMSDSRRRLAEQEARLRTVLETLPVGVWVIGADGQIRTGNRYARMIWGGASPAAVDLPASHGAQDAEARKGFAEYRDSIARALRGESSLNQVIDIEALDGATKTIAHWAVPIRDAEEQLVGAVVVDQDITERKQAEEALRASEERFNAFMDASPAIAWMKDINTGRYIYLNKSWQREFGISPGDVPATTEYDFAAPEFADKIRQNDAEALRSDKPLVVVEQTGGKERGPVRFWLSTKFPFANPTGQRLMGGWAIDITERKQVEAALQESEKRIRNLFEQADDGIFIITADHRYLDVNPAGAKMFGYRREEILELRLPDVLAEHERGRFDAEVKKLLAGTPHRGEWVHLRKDGSTFQADVSARAIGDGHYFSIVRDLTARNEAERALREGALRLEMAARAGNVGLFDWDLVTGKVFFTPEWKSQIGYDDDEIGNDLSEWEGRLHPDDRERTLQNLHKYLASPWPGTWSEFRLRHKNGTYRWILAQSALVLDDRGQPMRMLGSHVDITERKQADEARQKLETQLRQAQKMEALGTLAGGIAHDFNNILGAIIGNVELAQQDIGPQHPAQDSLAEIGKASARARDLVEQILTLSRQQPQTRRVIGLRHVVEESAKLLRASLPAGIELITTLTPDTPNVLADPTQIHQVLMNLCTNAWHAIGRGPGRIEIALAGAVIGGDDVRADLPPGRYARLTVTDSGQGMDASTLERVFDPFFTTKAPGEGTGLGLAVVDGIVKNHDGAITVDSVPGEGSAFQLYFPAVEAEAETVREARAHVPQGNSQRILYLDDEEPLVLLATRLLGRLGYKVTGFTLAADALAAFEADPAAFDVLVTDLNMPAISGLEVAARILRLRPGFPVALASGYVTDELRAKAHALGIREVIYKPNTVGDLAEAINRMVNALN
ncbi:MAG: PAS domain S-box protein [Candidatus Binatia bacterium]